MNLEQIAIMGIAVFGFMALAASLNLFRSIKRMTGPRADFRVRRLIGGEESGGMGIRGHIPEGDGVLMGLLLLEIISEAKAPLHELITDIQRQAS